MICCTECFDYPWLADFIRKSSHGAGRCDFCQSAAVPLVTVGRLSSYFNNLLSIYEPATETAEPDFLDEPWSDWDEFDDSDGPFNFDARSRTGAPLVRRIQEDWKVFSEKLLHSGRALTLLDSILNAHRHRARIDSTTPFVRSSSKRHSSLLERWQEFRDHVQEGWESLLPSEEPFRSHLSDRELGDLTDVFQGVLSRAEISVKAGAIFYRARKGCEKKYFVGIHLWPYWGKKMGPPPQKRARSGRANRKGQVVLYVADKEPTSIAEVRPARGLLVSVCKVRLKRDARLLDLGRPLRYPNPFTTSGLSYEMGIVDLLNFFARKLSMPLEREDDLSDYLPSQEVCEVIRLSHFDGICYPSALHPAGTNIVFFDPRVGEISDADLATVTEMTISYDKWDCDRKAFWEDFRKRVKKANGLSPFFKRVLET